LDVPAELTGDRFVTGVFPMKMSTFIVDLCKNSILSKFLAVFTLIAVGFGSKLLFLSMTLEIGLSSEETTSIVTGTNNRRNGRTLPFLIFFFNGLHRSLFLFSSDKLNAKLKKDGI